ncbi:MAG: malic enzyme [Cytophagaceae bacterium SCN 52-12]|nr:MAG: malic enzyme [Cytophagaceae bacterium SCN 52-12]
MTKKIRKEDALHYHAKGRPGKIQVVPTKEYNSQHDLTLAYSPGVAVPCLEIADNPEDAYTYTAKGNLVAVVSNGTAVLGLGNIGPEASKPVMEGKGLLFKIYADIDVFDLELNTTDVDEFVRTVKILEPTFGGINLEDIRSPECFEIEARLKKDLNIPVMHDDQHGTAIISGAALLNALELVGKDISAVKVVISGAGAAAISCARLYLSLGVAASNIAMFDINGHINRGRSDLDPIRQVFATEKRYNSMAEAFDGADVFLGLSVGNIVTRDMIRRMAGNPIVFAMANPDPEISYQEAVEARPDVIMATGRSDFPNQINNVLGFPYIFRGALDVRATEINEAMKLAAVYALANLAKKPVPDIVNIAYNEESIAFGRQYIIPKPVDPRLLTTVAPAVAKAAIETGVARKHIDDWEAYELELASRQGRFDRLSRVIISKAKSAPKRVVFADAENLQVLKAAHQVREEGIAVPVFLGDEKIVRKLIRENNLDLADVPVIFTQSEAMRPKLEEYAARLYDLRKRKGLSSFEATRLMYNRNYFGSMMVETGEADVLISGLSRNYPDTLRPALQIIGRATGVNRVAAMYILHTPHGPLFFSDTTVNLNPTAEELVEITELTAGAVEKYNIKPRIALVTYSNFGSAKGEDAEKMSRAVAILKAKHPDMIIDGEMQAHLALDTELLKKNHPFADIIDGGANTLIFPNLSASNIAYNLLKEAARLETIGPILLGLKKPVHVLQLGSSVREIVNMVATAVVDAQQ